MNNTYLSDEDYDFIYSRVPRICVDLLVKNPSGHILLTQRTIEPYVGHWHFPGGRIKFRESIEDAIKRIGKTELGVDLTEEIHNGKVSMAGTCEFPDEYQKGQPRHSISIVHEVQLQKDVVLTAHDKYSFVLEIPDPMIPPQQEFLIQKGYIK